jgi:hypothetical protein
MDRGDCLRKERTKEEHERELTCCLNHRNNLSSLRDVLIVCDFRKSICTNVTHLKNSAL